ncbi:MAG: hypothetical protein ACM3S1_01210 [Hyphomicrobiales bacterium]
MRRPVIVGALLLPLLFALLPVLSLFFAGGPPPASEAVVVTVSETPSPPAAGDPPTLAYGTGAEAHTDCSYASNPYIDG